MLCLALLFPVAAEETAGAAPPSIQAAKWLEIRPRVKIQLDFSGFRPELEDKRKIFDRRRLRLGADGTLFRDFEYTFRVETRTGDPEFRDVFLKYRRFRTFQIQAGRFKIPFGLDQLTDSGELDFVHRSRVGSILSPGRDTGAMILGEAPESKVSYAFGIFRHDGRNSEIEDFATINDYRPGGMRTLAARFTAAPAAFLRAPAAFRNLTLGTAFTRSDLVSGLSSLAGVTTSGQVFFPTMYVSGTRLRRGAELSWQLMSFSIKGEFVDVRDQRLGQGLGGVDLPALRTQGWYLSATHPLFGKRDLGDDRRLFSLMPGFRRGLVEAAVRYGATRFGAETAPAGTSPSRSSRAANVIGNEDRAWTFGINWLANRFVKFQFNGQRDILRDPVRNPIDGRSRYWTIVGRFQIYL